MIGENPGLFGKIWYPHMEKSQSKMEDDWGYPHRSPKISADCDWDLLPRLSTIVNMVIQEGLGKVLCDLGYIYIYTNIYIYIHIYNTYIYIYTYYIWLYVLWVG